MSSVKYVQPNSLIANINEKIDELNRKIIPTCTLKHSDQKQNVIQLIGKFKSAVTNILSQLNQNEVDYNTINFDELNDSLEKAYKLLLDEIVLPYEKIDITDINNRLNKLEDDLERSIEDKRGELDELKQRMDTFEDEIVDDIKTDIGGIKENWEYFEGTTFLSFREEVSSHYDEFIQLQNDVKTLQNDVKKGPSLPFPLNANSDLSTQMTWEECMQTIYFLVRTIYYGQYLIDFGAFTDECQNPVGQVGEAWSSFIVALRAAKNSYW
jgi:hypothetical protein